jgi:hypothetical protein
MVHSLCILSDVLRTVSVGTPSGAGLPKLTTRLGKQYRQRKPTYALGESLFGTSFVDVVSDTNSSIATSGSTSAESHLASPEKYGIVQC